MFVCLFAIISKQTNKQTDRNQTKVKHLGLRLGINFLQVDPRSTKGRTQRVSGKKGSRPKPKLKARQ